MFSIQELLNTVSLMRVYSLCLSYFSGVKSPGDVRGTIRDVGGSPFVTGLKFVVYNQKD